MNKFLHFISIFLILVAINSCIEGNPADIFGLDDPGDISGPRMISKVYSNNETIEEFTPNTGTLWRVVRTQYNNSTVQGFQTIYLKYNGQKLTEVEVNGILPGNINNGRAIIVPNYNQSGKMISLMNNYYENGIHKKHSISTLQYDSFGKISTVLTKNAIVNPSTPNVYVFTNVIRDVITYSGNNVSSVESNNMLVNSSGIITNNVKTTYDYKKFDWKINPYTTILDNYQIILGTIFTNTYVNLSDNNPLSVSLKIDNNPSTETVYAYKYDTHNYPTTNGINNFTYQQAP